jgi:DNA-binding MarR family transcriptional regulator
MQYPRPTSTIPRTAGSVARWIDLAQQIVVCGRILRDGLKRHLGRWELSEPEFSLLWACSAAAGPGMCQNELAGRLAVSPPQVSGLVEQLRRKGLLEGRRADDDRRRQLWQLTPAGQQIIDSAITDLGDWACGLDASLGVDQSAEFKWRVEQLARTITQSASAKARATAVSAVPDRTSTADTAVACSQSAPRIHPRRRGAA